MLVDELLALARIDAGQERHQGEVAALEDIVRDVVRRFESLAADRSISLVAHIATSARVAIGSGPAAIAFSNLLDNAIKFSPANSEVSIILTANDHKAVVVVADRGPGIDASEVPHLFDRFYRGHFARSDSQPGVGLGLALAQAIVHKHGGTIEARSNGDQGAEFSMRLPLNQNAVVNPEVSSNYAASCSTISNRTPCS